MSGISLIIIGCLMVVAGFAMLFVKVEADVTMHRSSSSSGAQQATNVPAMQATIIDATGKILVPDGVPVWDDRPWSYRIWDDACNTGPFALADGYRWYQLDKVGTPVTDEEMQQINWRRYGGQP